MHFVEWDSCLASGMEGRETNQLVSGTSLRVRLGHVQVSLVDWLVLISRDHRSPLGPNNLALMLLKVLGSCDAC